MGVNNDYYMITLQGLSKLVIVHYIILKLVKITKRQFQVYRFLQLKVQLSNFHQKQLQEDLMVVNNNLNYG